VTTKLSIVGESHREISYEKFKIQLIVYALTATSQSGYNANQKSLNRL
jgi:hypothetical protein